MNGDAQAESGKEKYEKRLDELLGDYQLSDGARIFLEQKLDFSRVSLMLQNSELSKSDVDKSMVRFALYLKRYARSKKTISRPVASQALNNCPKGSDCPFYASSQQNGAMQSEEE